MKTNGPPSKGGPEQHKNDLGKSITSSIAPGSSAISATNVINFEAAKTAAEAAVNLVPALSEHEVAQEFTKRHFDKVRFDWSSGAWYIFNGNHWKRDETRRAFDWTRELAAAMSHHEDASIKRRIGSRRFCEGVEGFARADQALAVTHEHWDNDIDILGTPSGIVNLRTGEVYDPDPEDYVTKTTAVGPDDSIDGCLRWLRFIHEITNGDNALKLFLQMWCGYCLTGEINEQKLLFLYGPGGTGKSTFINTMLRIMHDYAVESAMETFASSGGFDRHPEELARLAGRRLVVASETEDGHHWKEARIKTLTGGDMITARFMRQNSFDFRPQFKLTFFGNHAPLIRNLDTAIQRRFVIVPFNHVPAEKDLRLEEILQKEWPGILRWMINGARAWYEKGLIIPKAVTEATTRYFDEQNIFGQWLEECCEVDHKRQIYEKTVDLFASWAAFAKNHGEEPGNQRTFIERLHHAGFEKKQIKAIQTSGCWGIRLKHHRAEWGGT
jgi:putative DNA primase/helicase